MEDKSENYEIQRANSESKDHPVFNLNKSKGKWETDGESTKALLEIKFKKAIQIGGVRFENVNAAFIEILVKNEADKECQVLLPIRMVRTFQDCKNGKNRTKLLTFDSNDFHKPVLVKKWEYMRISVTQPWDNDTPIGLAKLQVYNFDKLPPDFKEIEDLQEVEMDKSNHVQNIIDNIEHSSNSGEGEDIKQEDWEGETIELSQFLEKENNNNNNNNNNKNDDNKIKEEDNEFSRLTFKQIKEMTLNNSSTPHEDQELIDLYFAISQRDVSKLTKNIDPTGKDYELRQKMAVFVQKKNEDESTESMEEEYIQKFIHT
jgi:hypothetical protein